MICIHFVDTKTGAPARSEGGRVLFGTGFSLWLKVPRELVAEVSLPPPKYEKGDSEMGKLKKKWSWRNAGANAGVWGVGKGSGVGWITATGIRKPLLDGNIDFLCQCQQQQRQQQQQQ